MRRVSLVENLLRPGHTDMVVDTGAAVARPADPQLT